MTQVFICGHSHDADEPAGMRGEALDRHVLSHSKRVSTFWITETQARARRITKWEKSGELVLEKLGYPWHGVVSFTTVPTKDYTLAELADFPPNAWDALFNNPDKRRWAEVCREIGHAAERLLLLQEYLETRLGADGCGEKSHADAAKAVTRLHLKLRKTLGYSYPAEGEC